MMKISKPVLMNDFTVSHVQFTSLNLVSFRNIKPVYDGNEKIQLEYEYPSKVEVSSRDWIGIFPRGWSNLQQYVTFEWISLSKPVNTEQTESGDVTRRTIPFCPKYHMNCVNQSAFYQFVYVGKQIEVLGVSSYFRFDLSCLNDSALEIECLVPITGKVRSTSVSDFGTVSMTNEHSQTSIDSRKLIHTSSIHSLQNLDIDGKLTWSRMNFTDDKKNMCLMKRTGMIQNGTGDNINPYSSHSEPGFPMSLPQSQCKKCYQFKRGGDILRSQQALQSKVGPCWEEALGFIYHGRTLGNPYFIQYKLKIVMERNKILEERAQEMKKELERLQNESKRMKMTYYNVNKEKVAYEKFVKDFIKSLEKDSIVRVMYGNTEILVKKVNYVGMEEHPRDKKTSKRERELKAVIGLQEITIRNLINSLQEKAKSVEELNQTVKLAQVFSAARTDDRELGIDTEESADELSNSDVASDYEFSIAKPQPPEEVSPDADEVLDSIRRTSEMELKNIGITRSLVNNSMSDLDVTNLSIMAYDSENAVPKKPRLVDGIEDCWPLPRNPTKTLRQKLSEDSMNVKEDNKHFEHEITQGGDNMRSEEAKAEKDGDMEIDPSVCEDYYDAYDAFSVRSFSPEPESTEESPGKGNDQEECDEKGDVMLTAIVPQENTVEAAKLEEYNTAKCAPEKFSKFTCEFSIDFVQRKCQPSQLSDRMICAPEEVKPQQNILALCQQQTSGSHVYSLSRERSLISFTKSNNGFEIKITKVDQNENPTRSFHQKMVVEFAGMKSNQEQSMEIVPAPVEADNGHSDEGSDIPMEKSVESKEDMTIASAPEEVEEAEVEEVEGEELEDKKEKEEKNTEIDVFSPRTVWNDANEDLEENLGKCEVITPDPPAEESDNQPDEKGQTEKLPEETPNKTNNKAVTEDSMVKLKVYQDSLRYEKNLQFFNGKFDDDGSKESDDETVKDKPSAIVIQTAQEKVAVIRLQ